jgi:hypothetical protein
VNYHSSMGVIWGINNDKSSLDLVEGGFVSIGWDDLGDLTPTRPEPKATRNFRSGGFSAPKHRSKLPFDLTELSTAR